ncbi:hypothetical protein QJQ45_014045 [Haematococcus lacustris]|nr:hypothetical protein QJQ45_014045 [Haematococcus lacustris]
MYQAGTGRYSLLSWNLSQTQQATGALKKLLAMGRLDVAVPPAQRNMQANGAAHWAHNHNNSWHAKKCKRHTLMRGVAAAGLEAGAVVPSEVVEARLHDQLVLWVEACSKRALLASLLLGLMVRDSFTRRRRRRLLRLCSLFWRCYVSLSLRAGCKAHHIKLDTRAIYGLMRAAGMLPADITSLTKFRNGVAGPRDIGCVGCVGLQVANRWIAFLPSSLPPAVQPSIWPNDGQTFAQVVHTDGVTVSLLFTRPKPAGPPDELPRMGKQEGAVNPLAHLNADWLGCDPGKTNMATVAHEERYPSGAVESVWQRSLTAGHYYRQSGITQHAKVSKAWMAGIRHEHAVLSQVTNDTASLQRYREYVAMTLVTWPARWAELSKPRWSNARFRLYRYKQSTVAKFWADTVRGARERCNSAATGHPLALAYGAASFSGSGSRGSRGVPVKQMLREACKQFPGRVVLVHEFRTSRVSSAHTDVVAGQPESFRWHTWRGMATRSRIRGLMCSTSNGIRFYDRDVSAALNIRRIAAGPGRPRELSSWLGRPAMPNPGRPGQEWPPNAAKQAPPSPQQHISPPSLLAEQATKQDPAAAGAGSAARSPAAVARAASVRVMPQGATSQPGEDAAAVPSPQAGGPDAHCLILPPHPSAIPDLASPPPDPPGTPSPPGSPLGPLPPLPILRKPALPSSVFRAAHHGSGPLPPGLAASPPQKVVQSGRLADAWGKGGGVGAQDSLDITAQRWSWAWRQVRTLLSVSQGFRTLRDQYQDQEIHSSELQVLKVLGEGAFARVELCLFTPSPEAQAARAAAQLSDTPASPLPTEGAPPASLPPQPLHTASQRRASAPALPTSTPEGGAGLQGAVLPAPPPIVTGAACAADARDLDPWLATPGQVPEVAASPPPRSVTSGGKHHSVAWASVHGMAAATDREEGPGAPGQLDRADSRMQSSSRRSAPSTRTSSRASRASADAVSRPRTVAVKRLKADVCGSSPAEVAAFMAEVALLRKLKHKHIVQYIGWGQGVPLTPSSLLVTTTGTRPTTPPGTPARVTNQQQDGPGAVAGGQGVGVRGGGEGGPLPGTSLFLVEEVLGGGTLKHLVVQQMKQACQTYRFVDALRWSHQVAAGLAYLHSRHPQIIHRDLKLENILLTDSDPQVAAAKISDFGLVALVAKSLLGERARHALAKWVQQERGGEGGRGWPDPAGGGPVWSGGVGGSSQAAPQQAEEAEDARAHAALNKSFCALITKHARKATAQPDPPAAVTRQRTAKVAPLKSSQTAKLAPASAAASAVKRSAASAPQPARTPRRNTQPQTLEQPPAGQGTLPLQPPLPPHPLPATHLQPAPPEQSPAAQPQAPVAPAPHPPSPLPCNAPAAGSPTLPAAPPAPHMAVQPASPTPTRPNQALLLLPPPPPPLPPYPPPTGKTVTVGAPGPPLPPHTPPSPPPPYTPH